MLFLDCLWETLIIHRVILHKTNLEHPSSQYKDEENIDKYPHLSSVWLDHLSVIIDQERELVYVLLLL